LLLADEGVFLLETMQRQLASYSINNDNTTSSTHDTASVDKNHLKIVFNSCIACLYNVKLQKNIIEPHPIDESRKSNDDRKIFKTILEGKTENEVASILSIMVCNIMDEYLICI
jgi:hypothetical protein